MNQPDKPIPRTLHGKQDAARKFLDDRMAKLLSLCGNDYARLISDEARLNTFLTTSDLAMLKEYDTSWIGGRSGSIPWLLSDHIARLKEVGIEVVERTPGGIIDFRRIAS